MARRQLAVPGIAVIRVLPQALVGAEGAWGVKALKILIALHPRRHRAILLLSIPVHKYDLVGVEIAEIDHLVDLVQHIVQFHALRSPPRLKFLHAHSNYSTQGQ